MVNFAVQIEPQFGYNFTEIYDICQAAENSGFSHAWFSDHFMMTADSIDLTSYECFTAMMAAASNTRTLKIGSLVFCNSYRHPAVLAKQIASLDHYSNGRIEFGYGSGWKKIEYDAYGIEFPSAKVRIKQLSEGIDIIRKLWTEEKSNYMGEYYSLTNAVSYPKPFQEPYPPIWVGTMEAKRMMLSLAAEKADGINIAWSFSPEIYQEKLNRIDEFCDKFDRDPKSLMKSYGVWTRIYESEEEKEKVWKEIMARRGFTWDELERRFDGSLHGTTEEIIDKLSKYIKLGIDHFIFMFPQNQEIESMRIFNESIIPKI
ncbi:MAG: LLM class flavin-dependent oxidoreductase [Candidatus Heimdallarchaeota archaeon]|nr:LLM class flavin-dependent oxidoreductase [Candidatus Heimdallarchaeota archaeon]